MIFSPSEILFFIFFVFIVLGMPIGTALGVSSIVVINFFKGPFTPGEVLFFKSAVTGGANFPLVAIPMFILAGDIMQSGGLSKRIIAFAAKGVSNLKGGLAYVNVLASMFFAAISGSSPATVAAIGSNMIPEMKKRGYSVAFSSALTASSGMIGVMIPPSIPFIIYGVSANVSISKLFLAGIIPGIMFAAGYMLMSRYLLRNFDQKENVVNEKVELTNSPNYRSSLWALLIPVIILGGIYGGVFTPTEAAGVAVIYSLLVSIFIYKEISLKDLPSIFSKSSKTAAICLVMVVMANIFGRILNSEHVPSLLANVIAGDQGSILSALIIMNIILLIVGMFMDTVAAIIILTPILGGVASYIGIDPVHFGVILVVNLSIGFCTPPLGVNLFVASTVADISIEKIFKSIIPFLMVMILGLILVNLIPNISLFLPNLFY